MAEFRRGVPAPRPAQVVELTREDFCQCDWPLSSDWGPEHCGRCKRPMWELDGDPWGVGFPD